MREYSEYSCQYYIDIGDKRLVMINNTACWAGLQSKNKYYYNSDTEKDQWGDYKRLSFNKPIDYIYIGHFRSTINSLANTKALVKLINEITECKIVTVKKEVYIKYKLINEGHYYSNLLLLNFIRMTWYKPHLFNYEQFFKDIRKKDAIIEDALYFLMDMTRINVETDPRGYGNYLNHSLIMLNIVPKTTKLLFEYKGDSMSEFLEYKLK